MSRQKSKELKNFSKFRQQDTENELKDKLNRMVINKTITQKSKSERKILSMTPIDTLFKKLEINLEQKIKEEMKNKQN